MRLEQDCSMIKPLEDALGKVLRLSEHKQAVAAELLEQFVRAEGAPYALSADERMAVLDALARAKQGDLATKNAVDAIVRRPWA
jgi:hypothetical protein